MKSWDGEGGSNPPTVLRRKCTCIYIGLYILIQNTNDLVGLEPIYRVNCLKRNLL